MPILWRYLLKGYMQVFVLCVLSFVSILLVTQFQDIARFASSGTSMGKVALFALYQIPHVLPMAIPISCLVGSILLFQKLSHTHELTAMRSAGIGLFPVAFPILFVSVVLSVLCFTVISEVAPACRVSSKKLIYEATSANPLFLFQKETLVRLKNAHVDMRSLRKGQHAKDVVFIINNPSHGRLGMMIAKDLIIENDLMLGKRVSWISSIDGKTPEGYDHLVIENQNEMATKASNLSQFLYNTNWYSSEENLNMRMIMAKGIASQQVNPSAHRSCLEEVARRSSLALAAFTFSLIGVSFGMEIGRSQKKKGILYAIALAAIFMVCYISAKSFRHAHLLSILIYCVPHPLIIMCCFGALRRITRGAE